MLGRPIPEDEPERSYPFLVYTKDGFVHLRVAGLGFAIILAAEEALLVSKAMDDCANHILKDRGNAIR